MNYKTWISSLFDRSASDYGKAGSSYFSYFAENLVKLVTILPAAHILDVATGRGAILKRAADKMGSEGKAIGIDLSAQMVAETQAELKHLSQLQVKQMDAEELEFADDSFDIVFCGFALFFMPNIERIVSEFKRVLKPNGVVAISIWGERSQCARVFREAAQTLGVDLKVTAHNLRDPGSLVTVLANLNFADIRVTPDFLDHVHPTISTWWESLWTHGTRGILERLSESQQQKLFRLVSQKLESHLQADGLHEDLQAFYITAIKS